MRHQSPVVLRFSPEGEVLEHVAEWKKHSDSMYRRIDWAGEITWYHHTNPGGILGEAIQATKLPAAIKTTCLLLNLPLT